MTNDLEKRFGRRRAVGFGTVVAAAVVLAALQACGGGGNENADTATAAAMAPTDAADMVPAEADVRKKFMFAGSTQGFAASALNASMPAGTANDYDVLVVGDVDQGGAAVETLVRQALDSGKEVVFDAASDGSARATHADILQRIVGTTIDSAAVRVQKADKGYYVTPIDAPAVASTKLKSAAAHDANPSSNSVQSVFGIPVSETAQ
jgi:hypothetical protein